MKMPRAKETMIPSSPQNGGLMSANIDKQMTLEIQENDAEPEPSDIEYDDEDGISDNYGETKNDILDDLENI